MLFKTLIHRHGEGWLAPLPSELDSPNTLVLAFGATLCADHPDAFAELAAAFPRSVIAGYSTSGEIAGTQVSDSSISVAVACFTRTTLCRALTAVASAGDSRAANALPRNCRPMGLRAVFVLSDGLNVNGTALVEGLGGSLPSGVSISGGLAGDGSR
ncbi:MAG: hypothetical protein IPG91_06740 [Ideonella sp.]|nr:hypothetical protein [Ideonella sp.]